MTAQVRVTVNTSSTPSTSSTSEVLVTVASLAKKLWTL